jgi:hypothetical protein
MSAQDDPNGPLPIVKKDDSFAALTILILAVVVVLAGLAYSWRNKRKSGKATTTVATATFQAPAERNDYITAKAAWQPGTSTEELKKLLMRRALKVIPMLIQYQNEGQSIERLYKRGMLTDDMHYKVKELKDFFDQVFQVVKSEADELADVWGQYIWEQANYFNQVYK